MLLPSSVSTFCYDLSSTCAFSLRLFIYFLPPTNQPFPWPLSLYNSRPCLLYAVHSVPPFALLLYPDKAGKKILRNDVTFLSDRSLNLWCMLIQFERPYSPEVENISGRPNSENRKTFPQQRIRTQQWWNCWGRGFLCRNNGVGRLTPTNPQMPDSNKNVVMSPRWGHGGFIPRWILPLIVGRNVTLILSRLAGGRRAVS
jgi:hypothetical protein